MANVDSKVLLFMKTLFWDHKEILIFMLYSLTDLLSHTFSICQSLKKALRLHADCEKVWNSNHSRSSSGLRENLTSVVILKTVICKSPL